MINTALDGMFSLLMWMLMNPIGRAFFFIADFSIVIAGIWFVMWTKDDP